MSSVQHIRRMNENGVKKMCRNIFSLQQTLTSITLAREPALDHARQYFELLCATPEVEPTFFFLNIVFKSVAFIISITHTIYKQICVLFNAAFVKDYTFTQGMEVRNV
jgi:hypothetical protein